jgi:hypothetical protein
LKSNKIKQAIYQFGVDITFWVKGYVKIFFYKTKVDERELFKSISNFLPEPKGKYWDVGANHPRENSVTYPFYLRGWSGVTIEPISRYVKMHKIIRKRDKQFCGVISPEQSELLFYYIPTQYSTTSVMRNQDLIDKGFRPRKIVTVKALNPIDCFEKVTPDYPTLLKVDIEGSDFLLLGQLDLSLFTPRVIIIEGLTQSKEIQDLLSQFEYQLSDQLNIQGSIFVHRSWNK